LFFLSSQKELLISKYPRRAICSILLFIYSEELRVGEFAKFKHENIDSKRGLIHIKGSKGRKYR